MAQKVLESSRKFQKASLLWPNPCQGSGLPAMLGKGVASRSPHSLRGPRGMSLVPRLGAGWWIEISLVWLLFP